MAKSAILSIKILADAKGAQQGMAQAESATKKFGGVATRVAGIAGIALAGGAFKATQGAADLAETMSKMETVFGASSAAMEKWSEGAAKAFGLSQQEALDAASGFQVMFTQLGIGAGTSETMSKGMIQAAADLASFHNVAGGTAEVTDMMSSAMRGEYDSLQRLIPNINAAKVQQEAMQATGKKSAKQLTDSEKAAATYALILKGMGPAAGDYAKTAEGAANSQRTLTATMKDTSASLGEALLPALKGVLDVANKFADWAKENPGLLKVIIGVIGGLVAAVYAINTALKVYRATMIVVTAVQSAMWLTNPIFLVVLAIVAVVAIIVLLWKRSKTFRKIVLGAWDAIKKAASAVAKWVKRVWTEGLARVKRDFNTVKGVVLAVFDWIKSKVSTTVEFFKTAWKVAIDFVKGAFRLLFEPIQAVFGWIVEKVTAVTGWFIEKWQFVVDNWSTIWGFAMAFVTAPFDAIIGAVQTAIGWVDSLIEKITSLDFNFTPGFDLPGWLPGTQAVAPQLSATARGAGPTTRAGAGPTYVINVHGAIDPEGTARTIKRVLEGHGRRVGVAR